MFVWFDGKVIPEKEAVININTPAFRYGQGFFTTTRIEEGVPIWLYEHVERLNAFLAAFACPVFPEEPVIKAARLIPFMNGISRGGLRIIAFPEGERSKVWIGGESLPLSEMPPVKIARASFYRHSTQPLLRVKSLNYWENILAYEEAEKRGFYDALFLNEKGEVCETSRCNIFWLKDGIIYTPGTECGILPGIGRQKLIGLCQEEGIKVKTGNFKQEDLKNAEEVFLTNSLRGIVPVKEIEENRYDGDGKIVSFLREKWEKKIQDYIKSNLL